MRLTADLINNSLSYLNPLKERELDLRGHKIPTIENLGVAKDQEAYDLTDNDLTTLSHFPLSPRLKSLYVARNRISSLQLTLARSVPNLTNLVLTQNALAELVDLVTLRDFRRLLHLCLIENPVAAKENYRYWVIWLCPSVRFLDFQRVKDVERSKATALFGTIAEPSDLATSIMAAKTSINSIATTNGKTGNGAGSRTKLTEKENQRMRQLIHKATTLAEVARLEKDWAEGRIPAGVLGADDE